MFNSNRSARIAHLGKQVIGNRLCAKHRYGNNKEQRGRDSQKWGGVEEHT